MKPTSKDAPNLVVDYLRRLYRPTGFRKGYTFALWLLLGGALMGFSLTRLRYLNFRGVMCPNNPLEGGGRAVPGECYYFENLVGRTGIMMHLATILPASVLVVFQFVPASRYRFPIFHRINGYILLLLSVISMIGVLMIAKPTFGGTLAMQSATGTSVIIFLVCLGLGYYNIKKLHIDQHRAWMLRAWVIVSLTTEDVLLVTR
jgi:hypothetical protein